ncbi:MAG: helix-turn-helix transcriptional regulator [Planctomycetota bacterium]|nr:helix-turn-helix transcriptional regulator [Planctomycetota bacterium]
MVGSNLHQRLRAVTGHRSYREIAELTGTHPETVRRYMLGQSPSIEFISALSSALQVNGEWLLTGRGPSGRGDIRAHALREANPTELLNAVAATLERLMDRVERLETFLHTMEARLRAAPPVSSPHADRPVVSVPDRPLSIADAIGGGAPADAGRPPPPGNR